jgi:hypothetical protein
MMPQSFLLMQYELNRGGDGWAVYRCRQRVAKAQEPSGEGLRCVLFVLGC